MKTVILGAGPCGLTAAWELSKKNIPVTVIEKEGVVGGLCKTVSKDGFQFDLGGHRFISKDKFLIEDIKNLLGDELLTQTRKSIIKFCNREYEYPLNIWDIVKSSSLPMNIGFAYGYLESLAGIGRSNAPAYSFDRWIDERFGKRLNDIFFRPYTEKLWGIRADRLSDDWAVQRISIPNGKELLLKLLNISNKSPRTYAAQYLYPKSGIGGIFNKMAGDIRSRGGEVITSVSIKRIQAIDNGRFNIFVNDENGERIFEADRILSTIPLDILAQLLGDNTAKLPYRSLRFLNITLNRTDFSDNTWIYIPERDFIMTRIQEPKRRSPFSAPHGKTSIMLEIPCEYNDRIWNMPDNELFEKVLIDLKGLRFDIKGDVINYFSNWARHAYPRYEMGYSYLIEGILKGINRYKNITTLGRQGLFRYTFMDTAMLMGKGWANAVINKGDIKNVSNIGTELILSEAQSIA